MKKLLPFYISATLLVMPISSCGTVQSSTTTPILLTATLPSPTETLVKMVDESSYVSVARTLGVSDNAIRKRITNHQTMG